MEIFLQLKSFKMSAPIIRTCKKYLFHFAQEHPDFRLAVNMFTYYTSYEIVLEHVKMLQYCAFQFYFKSH